MGRHALLTALVAAAACASEAPAPAEGPAHARLACVSCHDGGLSDRALAAVPSGSCTASGCHRDNVPAEVTLASVRFRHLGHGAADSLATGCAGCHGHRAGGEPLSAGSATCGLCHADELSGARPQDCRLCHDDPTHVGRTSQGVDVPHRGLPWIEGGCLRCHYQVARPPSDVGMEPCARCHADPGAITPVGIGRDLHPAHTGVSCTGCHHEDTHRIEAMSSAVELSCADCHAYVHETEVGHGWADPGTCNACHNGIHAEAQALLLGLTPVSDLASPSDHFMDGLTCRSCHEGDGSAGGACADCHRTEFTTVLAMWRTGLRERTELTEAYVSGAARAVAGLPPDDPGRAAAERAGEVLAFLGAAEGVHNPALAHELFGSALSSAREAYARAGRTEAPPDLGRAPRRGICTYCHYGLEGPSFSEAMAQPFHREVMGGRR